MRVVGLVAQGHPDRVTRLVLRGLGQSIDGGLEKDVGNRWRFGGVLPRIGGAGALVDELRRKGEAGIVANRLVGRLRLGGHNPQDGLAGFARPAVGLAQRAPHRLLPARAAAALQHAEALPDLKPVLVFYAHGVVDEAGRVPPLANERRRHKGDDDARELLGAEAVAPREPKALDGRVGPQRRSPPLLQPLPQLGVADLGHGHGDAHDRLAVAGGKVDQRDVGPGEGRHADLGGERARVPQSAHARVQLHRVALEVGANGEALLGTQRKVVRLANDWPEHLLHVVVDVIERVHFLVRGPQKGVGDTSIRRHATQRRQLAVVVLHLCKERVGNEARVGVQQILDGLVRGRGARAIGVAPLGEVDLSQEGIGVLLGRKLQGGPHLVHFGPEVARRLGIGRLAEGHGCARGPRGRPTAEKERRVRRPRPCGRLRPHGAPDRLHHRRRLEAVRAHLVQDDQLRRRVCGRGSRRLVLPAAGNGASAMVFVGLAVRRHRGRRSNGLARLGLRKGLVGILTLHGQTGWRLPGAHLAHTPQECARRKRQARCRPEGPPPWWAGPTPPWAGWEATVRY